VVRTDGLKLVLADGSWRVIPPFGTEPVVGPYTRPRSKEGLEKLSAAAKAWIFGLGPPSRPRIFPRQYSGEGLRAVLEEQGAPGEEMAARYVEQTRPVWTWIAAEWRRVGLLRQR